MTELENLGHHCWEDGPHVDLGDRTVASTCMLLDGHEGDHEFTPDNEITIRFKAPD
jgi:hypothetical protein